MKLFIFGFIRWCYLIQVVLWISPVAIRTHESSRILKNMNHPISMEHLQDGNTRYTDTVIE
jgi:hypothetical protein